MDMDQKAPPKTPDPWDVLAGIQQALATIASRPAQATDPALIDTLSKAMDRLAVVQEQGAERIATETKRAARPSNEIAPMRSVYTPRGRDYQVMLRCKMMIPWEVDEKTSTREEIELLNLVQQGEYRVRRSDGTAYVEKVTTTTDLNGKPSLVNITNETAFNNDNYKSAPGIVDRLRQILKQHSKEIQGKAAAVLSMDEEDALIAAGDLAVTV
jgi:hypothetical protein